MSCRAPRDTTNTRARSRKMLQRRRQTNNGEAREVNGKGASSMTRTEHIKAAESNGGRCHAPQNGHTFLFCLFV